MVTDRAEDLRSIMSDNATYIQFPPLGSSTSLITVYGDHRVNIQRTVRSIMQLVSIELFHPGWNSLLTPSQSTGLSILRCFLLASASTVQCSITASQHQYVNHHRVAQANIHCDGCGSRFQEYVLRNART